MTTLTTPAALDAAKALCTRVLVGVDGSEAGREACRQAAALAEPDANVEALAVVHIGEAGLAGYDAPRVADELEREAEQALDEALEILGPAVRRRVDGFVAPVLRSHAETPGTTLLVLGTHGHRRLTEILIGGVAGELLHTAPCSVLVARPPKHEGRFPQSIVVGVDESEGAAFALAAAQRLAARFGAHLRTVEAAADPVDVLVDASEDADLLVVGSRGLHGLKSLGSVSERVAHRARCSVLVVRRAA
jgi:nucleotide-binding universal stress UspA family protein